MGCDKLPWAFRNFKYVGASDGANVPLSLNGRELYNIWTCIAMGVFLGCLRSYN